MQNNGCLICGKALIYPKNSKRKKCRVCGKIFDADAFCLDGHYICDNCHSGGAMSVIRAVCLEAAGDEPYAVALAVMRSPAVHMHGPEHHIIVGSALAAAYCRAAGQTEKLAGYLNVIEKRGKKVPGGTCGFWGACGAALGAGIFLSAVTETTPLDAETHGLCNRLTARCLMTIGEIGGPRCCKRNTGLAISEAAVFVREHLGVSMSKPQIICEFSERNKECIGTKCPFSAV
ncbi:MAG: DUF5714 domain-containing protein [Oscillospiraceae bacterium]|jgi:hypothetical protein|nr:DUF5714 domain-containing protein [Oscillospiraceae bacterium]